MSKPEKPMTSRTFRIPTEYYAHLQKRAKLEYRTATEVLKELIRKDMNQNPTRGRTND